MYSDKAQGIIDVVLRKEMTKVGLPMTTDIFTDKEAQKGECISSLSCLSAGLGEGVASRLMELAPKLAKKHGYKKISLNVDLRKPSRSAIILAQGFQND